MIIDCGDHMINSDHVGGYSIAKEKLSGKTVFSIKVILICKSYELTLAVYDTKQDAEKAMAELFEAFDEGWRTFSMPEHERRADHGRTD
jgi:hypothetical protein